jgi:hypothetical protein
LVWKSAGGQGDHEISLPLGSFEEFIIFFLFWDGGSVANPLLISKTKIYTNKNKMYFELINFL